MFVELSKMYSRLRGAVNGNFGRALERLPWKLSASGRGGYR